MKISSRHKLQVLCTIVFLICWEDANAIGQTINRDQQTKTIKKAGFRRLDKFGTKFERDGTLMFLEYDSTDLTSIQFVPKGGTSLRKFDGFLKFANRIRSIGKLQTTGVFGLIGPSGHVTSTINYSNAYVRRSERNCSGEKKSKCQIGKFTVFFWFELNGVVENKRIQHFVISSFVDYATYLITVNSNQYEVSKYDFEKIVNGQYIKIKASSGGSFVSLIEPKL